jgi:hypothetical protein
MRDSSPAAVWYVALGSGLCWGVGMQLVNLMDRVERAGSHGGGWGGWSKGSGSVGGGGKDANAGLLGPMHCAGGGA